MVRLCQNCGRSAPNDAVLCPYCGIHIDYSKSLIMPDPEQKKDNKLIIIVAVVVILLIVIPIAIAATVYVYISGMLGPETTWDENATVSVLTVDRQIQVTLTKKGDSYHNGYLYFHIYINNELVDDLSEVGYWTLRESIIIGEGNTGYEVGGSPLSTGVYDIRVSILGTVIYAESVEI